jgi:hypothetical protein
MRGKSHSIQIASYRSHATSGEPGYGNLKYLDEIIEFNHD